jgi:broad specificity phosphatase PhoE
MERGMALTTLYLIRHAETTWNAEQRLQGNLDAPLSDRGARQVARLVEALRAVPLAAVYSSPLDRAVQTALPVAAPHGLAVDVIEDLREVDQGEWESRLLDEVAAQDGERLQTWWNAPHTVRLPAGESLIEVQERALRALWTLEARHHGQTVGIVAHGGVNKTILLEMLGAPLASYWRLRQHNACVNIIEAGGAQPRVALLNETAHLGPDA